MLLFFTGINFFPPTVDLPQSHPQPPSLPGLFICSSCLEFCVFAWDEASDECAAPPSCGRSISQRSFPPSTKVHDSYLPVLLSKLAMHKQCRNQALHPARPSERDASGPVISLSCLPNHSKKQKSKTNILPTPPPPTSLYPSRGQKKVWEQQTDKNGAVKNQRSHRQLCQLASHRPQRKKN